MQRTVEELRPVKSMRKAVLGSLGLFLLGLVLTGAQCQEKVSGPTPQTAPGKQENASEARAGGSVLAPDFVLLPVAGGQPGRLSDHKGNVVVLNFFTTWCRFCNEEAPQLEALNKKYARRGLEVLAVCFDAEDTAAVKSFIAAHGVTYPIFAGSAEARAAYGITGFPTTVVIDREGRERAKFPGLVGLEQFEAAVGPLLSETK